MKISLHLFQSRRWMLWLPLLAAGVLSSGNLADFAKLLIGGLVFWIPYWLAWWLSDGFSSIRLGSPISDWRSLNEATPTYYNISTGFIQNHPGVNAYRTN